MVVPDGEQLFIGDGGLETTLIFHQGIELPEFAAFPLLREEAGREALRRYYGDFAGIARDHRAGFILDTPTWRASPNWGERLGYSAAEVADVNREAVQLAEEIRAAEAGPGTPIAICGSVGPEGDAYRPERFLSAEEAERYHSSQIGALAGAGVDMVAAYTLCYVEEAVGIVRAAAAAGCPVSIAFTVETDGRLPNEEPLGEAIERVDAETAGASAYFMVNCAHTSHFAEEIESGGTWLERLGGIRANASRLSHAELDEADDLDDGDPAEMAAEYAELRPSLPALRVVGGCCGTDRRHVARICAALDLS
ncbi:MAG TPA: homocysteine S-methyltransferase family protein [Solirubrobacterales bacterium]|nr:homocysteine S-methyltransferase family protein [Solirubrobacterales bacterium]